MLDILTSYENINETCFTGLAFVDLKKAFDTTSYSSFMVIAVLPWT